MKNLPKEKGFINLWVLLFIVLVLCIVLSSVDDYRTAIADDIKSGTLIDTVESHKWLLLGDECMESYKTRLYPTKEVYRFPDNSWQVIFFAKVCYERARLEMERNKRTNRR